MGHAADRRVAGRRLAAKTSLVSRAFEQIHAREHSLELQLPFLARVLPDTPVIPILMGDQSRGVAFGLGDALAETFGGRDVALVASSDLSHYQDAVTAQTMDRVVLDSLDAFDAERLMAALEREPHHACGGGPMVAVLRAARAWAPRRVACSNTPTPATSRATNRPWSAT